MGSPASQSNILWVFDLHVFNLLLYFLIVANTGVIIAELSLPSDEASFDAGQRTQKDVFDVMNYAFSAIFCCEMFLKCLPQCTT